MRLWEDLDAEVFLEENTSIRLDEILFGEAPSRIIVSVNPDITATWESYLEENLPNNWQKIGKVTTLKSSLKILTKKKLSLINVKINEVRISWSEAIAHRLNV